jgi:diguanylate cyclase (GGDEF)-like protein
VKRVLIPAFLALGGLATAWAGPSAPSSPSMLSVAPLTSASAIRALSKAKAGSEVPVDFKATVTYFRGYRHVLFVQDQGVGVYVKATTQAKLVPGDRVLIKGTTAGGYRPYVLSSDISVLHHEVPPKPLPATFDEMIRGHLDSVLVTAHGVVQSADLDSPSVEHAPGTTLKILLDGGYVDAQVESDRTRALDELLDAEVEIKGVAGGKFDGKHQLTGIVLYVAGLDNIKILKRAAVSPWLLPITPMDQILSVYHVQNLTKRVRVVGTVTYFEPGSALVLQQGDKSIWVTTQSLGPMRIGDMADAIGFPAVSNGVLMLYDSAIRDSGRPAPVSATPVAWSNLTSSRHIFDLVSIEGQVMMEAREASQDEYVLSAGGQMFSAIYTHRQSQGIVSPMREIPVGATIRVTGICATDSVTPYGHDIPFKILMRTPNDLAILSRPSWFTVRHLGSIAILLLMGMLAVGARAWYIDRTMRARVAALGYLGQRRGLILEDINNSRPLLEILERITELGSATLKGAPCWCRVADGFKIGNSPAQTDSSGLRIIERPITSRTGPALGTVYAAFAAGSAPRPDEDKGLASVAELATLAIETARLYSDLIHRSEFDMLTDIKNRFSFEKHLDDLIDEGYNEGNVFGLIFIDLDDFKLVNDRFGHHVGDQYMQQAALRMKRQLRPEDIFARLGGDEFGVLVPIAQDRSNVEEIALRLEDCFEDPFSVKEHVFHGSASIGVAVYPTDGTSGDALLNSADTAMYAMKKHRKSLARNRNIPVAVEFIRESCG